MFVVFALLFHCIQVVELEHEGADTDEVDQCKEVLAAKQLPLLFFGYYYS